MGNSQNSQSFEKNCQESIKVLKELFKINDIDLRFVLLNKQNKNYQKYVDELSTMNTDCTFEVETHQNVFNLILKNKKYIVGYLSIKNTSNECSTINYRCVKSDYYRCGIGEFLGFVAIFLSNYVGMKYIYSLGVSDISTQTSYSRMDETSDIVVSQKILIVKFGFVDAYKGKYNDEMKAFFKKFMTVCKDGPETYLDLKLGDLRLYENYKFSLLHQTKTVFEKYNIINKKVR